MLYMYYIDHFLFSSSHFLYTNTYTSTREIISVPLERTKILDEVQSFSAKSPEICNISLRRSDKSDSKW
jgi:hypothetical protein